MYSVSLKKTLSLLVAFAMVFGMIAMVQPMQAKAATVEIAISNGDFENGAFGGNVAGSNGATIVEKVAYEGAYALKFDATGEILTVTGYLPEATTAESTVTLSFWAKVMGGSTGNSVNYGMFATNASWGNRVQKYGAGYPVPGGDWKQISQVLTVPAETKIIQAQIYLGSENTIAIIDNVSMTGANGNEILHSGGFEKGVLNDDFNANDALEIVGAPVHSGNFAAHADKSAGNGAITTTVSFAPSSSDRTMNFNFWMYAATNVNSAHTQIAFFDTSSGNWNNLGVKYGAKYATPQTWVNQNIEIAVPANTDTIQVMLYAQDDGADFYIDDITLTEEVKFVNHDIVLGFNQVTDDGTWQFSISEAPADKYYKVPAIIDGVECNFLMGESGGLMCVYPNFFPALGGAVPTQQIIIKAGAVLKAVDANGGWAEIEGADTYTLTEAIDLSFVNGAWSKTSYTKDVTMTLNQVTGDGTWQFSISEAPADKYYKVPAIVDGAACNILMGESGGIMCVYPNFFPALGGAVPAESFVIEEGAAMKAVDSTNGWQEIEGATVLVVSEKIDLSYVNGVWGKTVYTSEISLSLNQVTDDGTWQFSISEAPADKYYKVPAIVDGAACNILMGESGGIMCVYPNFFPALGGAVPAESFVIEEGAVLKAVDSTNGWQEIEGTYALVVTNGLNLVNHQGTWMDPSQIVETVFTELKASDLSVYRAEDQAAEQYRSTFAISSAVAIGNDGWANFEAVDAKVLVDGVQTNAIFGMVPASDSSWANESAFLLYITGEGYWDAASTAASVTICAGTKIVSPLDNTKGFVFTEDFVIYKNEDGSWDTTENPEVEKQEIVLGFNTVTGDGTWQLGVTGEAIPVGYYKIASVVDGNACNVLAQYNGNILIIYPNFFPALGGAVPAESYVIAAGTTLKAVDPNNNWNEMEATPVVVTSELKVEKIQGKWYEMSKYADVNFTEIYAADLDMYYYNIVRLGDYSDFELNMALMTYPEYKDLVDFYGRDANLTTFGIKSTIPSLQIPNHASWPNFSLIGTITVEGAEPWETYVMHTPASGTEDAETAMDNAFLVRFINGFVGDQAASITIEPGTMIVSHDGTAGFIFVDGYTLYRDSDGNWSENAPVSEPIVDENLKFDFISLSYQDYIGLQFIASQGSYDRIYLEVVQNTWENGSFTDVTSTLNPGEYYGFKFFEIGVASWSMTEEISVVLCGEKDGVTYVGQTMTTTIEELSINFLMNNAAAQPKDAKVIVDMLNYGAAVQIQHSHNVENLANANVAPYISYGTSTIPVMDADATTSGEDADMTVLQYSISMMSRVELQWVLNGDASNYEVRYTADGVEGKVSYEEFVDYYGYKVACLGIKADCFRKTYTAAIYDVTTGEIISKIYTFSVEAFAEQLFASQQDVVVAMMRYGDAVSALVA